jgi:hypothetical protein
MKTLVTDDPKTRAQSTSLGPAKETRCGEEQRGRIEALRSRWPSDVVEKRWSLRYMVHCVQARKMTICRYFERLKI